MVSAFGVFLGPWGHAFHGPEAECFMGSGAIAAGITGTVSSYIFLIMFFGHFIKMLNVRKKFKKGDIKKDKLSKKVKRHWVKLQVLTWVVMISGLSMLVLSSLINDGFFNISSFDSGGNQLTFIIATTFCSAFTLWLLFDVMVFHIIKADKIPRPESQREADRVYFNEYNSNGIFGIAMLVFFFIPFLTILASGDTCIPVPAGAYGLPGAPGPYTN